MMTVPTPLLLPGNGTPRQLSCRVLQSPLAGVSDRVFRSLVRRWAPDALLFTEMVNATSLELGHGTSKVQELAEECGPVAVQLFDHRPGAMAEAARRAEGAGAFLIDINMGCPVKKIARKGGGSGLIRDPDLAARILEAVAAAVRIPVTVKTRLGWCGNPDAVAWCRRLEEAGAQLLTLHGRTREQGFRGQADWAAIAVVKRALHIPVIANGDVCSPEEAQQCLALTGADGVMVGRGTMGAPWLVGQIDAALSGRPVPPTPDSLERVQLAREQLQALVLSHGHHGLLIARKHMSWTCTGFPGASQLRHALMRAPTVAEALDLLHTAAIKAAPPASGNGLGEGRSRAAPPLEPWWPGPAADQASPPAVPGAPAPAAPVQPAAAAPRASGGPA
jgi:tRNA-dihydrouridine synthase B